MVGHAFSDIHLFMRNGEGLASELDNAGQTSWLLFLKCLNDLEAERRDTAEFEGPEHARILDARCRRDAWAAPKKDGKLDHDAALAGTDMLDFVKRGRFPDQRRQPRRRNRGVATVPPAKPSMHAVRRVALSQAPNDHLHHVRRS